MKTTFHEVELGKAVVQNASEIGTEQLIVTIHPESKSSIQIQIRQNTDGSSTTSSAIAIDQHGLRKLVDWLREENVLS